MTDNNEEAAMGRDTGMMTRSLLSGGLAAAQVFARRREQKLVAARSRSEEEARDLLIRHQAERRAAETELARLDRPETVQRLSDQDLRKTWDSAVEWSADSSVAAAAERVIEEEARRRGVDLNPVAGNEREQRSAEADSTPDRRAEHAARDSAVAERQRSDQADARREDHERRADEKDAQTDDPALTGDEDRRDARGEAATAADHQRRADEWERRGDLEAAAARSIADKQSAHTMEQDLSKSAGRKSRRGRGRGRGAGHTRGQDRGR